MILFALLGGGVAFIVAALGSTQLALVSGLICFVIGMVALAWRTRPASPEDPADPGRRRFLTLAGLGGFAWLFVGGALGRATRSLTLPDPVRIQDAMANDLGAEYMELIRRAYHPGRSGELQLVLAPYNSSNYPPESRDLVRFYRATSHASVWMYLERVPLVVHAPGRLDAADDTTRVTLADLAPTTAALMGSTSWPADREGSGLAGDRHRRSPPKVIVTFVIDGGGWNVLQHWPDSWPNLKRLMGQGVNYRNAITGSFPAVTACAHATIGTGTFPDQHGITGHNIRDGSKVRKAYGDAGHANPGRPLDPHARRPVERRDRQPGVGGRDRLPGLAHGDDRPRRSDADRRSAPRRRLLERGGVQGERHRRVGAAQPRSLPDAVDRPGPGRVRRAPAGVHVSGMGPDLRPARDGRPRAAPRRS